MKQKPLYQSGFTLVELMIVIAIIGVLAAIAIPQFSLFTKKTMRAEAIVALSSINKAETSYFGSEDTYAVKTTPADSFNQVLLRLGLEDLTFPTTKAKYSFSSMSASNVSPEGNNLDYGLIIISSFLDADSDIDALGIYQGSTAAISGLGPEGIPFVINSDI